LPFARPEGDPQPLPYLDSASNRAQGALDIDLEVLIQTDKMRQAGEAPVCISRSNFAQAAYWTVAQMVAHHTVNGCSLSAGDLFGSGTLSGPTIDQSGSLLELSQGGKQAICLPNGEQRTFLLDGDSITLKGRCARQGARSIGFGLCEGTVVPVTTQSKN
jgi:fumarylacetoacetase